MVSLSEYLRNTFGGILPGINLILYAVVLIGVIRFRPTGILGWYSHSDFRAFLEGRVLGRDISKSGVSGGQCPPEFQSGKGAEA